MKKIFEIREYGDGGPFVRGTIIGYIQTDKTRAEMVAENGHGFIDYHEISKEEYLRRKKAAEKVLEVFNIENLE